MAIRDYIDNKINFFKNLLSSLDSKYIAYDANTTLYDKLTSTLK